jgi:hypothetical protein
MAAHAAVSRLAVASADGALVAPEAYVTKPDVRSCFAPDRNRCGGLVRSPDAVA